MECKWGASPGVEPVCVGEACYLVRSVRSQADWWFPGLPRGHHAGLPYRDWRCECYLARHRVHFIWNQAQHAYLWWQSTGQHSLFLRDREFRYLVGVRLLRGWGWIQPNPVGDGQSRGGTYRSAIRRGWLSVVWRCRAKAGSSFCSYRLWWSGILNRAVKGGIGCAGRFSHNGYKSHYHSGGIDSRD